MNFYLQVCFLIALTFRIFADSMAICAIFQNDAKYLPEWIEFHLKQGVSHFFLYNNLSTDNYQELLIKYIDKGQVEVVDWPFSSQNVVEWNAIQCNAYKDGVKRALNGRYTWCAFLDTDEFLFAVNKTPLPVYLKRYKAPGVMVNWVMYGTSNVEKIPEGGKLLDTLVWRAPLNYEQNKLCKTIVRPEWVEDCTNPHFFIYRKNKLAVNENGTKKRFEDMTSVSVNRLRINHYWTRDKDFFYQTKLARRIKWFDEYERSLRMESEMNVVYDPILANR